MKVLATVCACCVAASVCAAQDELGAARELYASAAYEEALTALSRLREVAPPASSEQVDEYRAFCLFALGRTAEARQVVESLITRNPLLELDANDASPRITALFTDVRKELLPVLVRQQYEAAKAAVDKKEYADAEPQLVRVRRIIDEAQKAGASDPTFSDIRMLVDGFLDLTRAGLARVQRPPASAVPATSAVSSGSAVAAPPTAAPVRPAPPAVYDATASDVLPPLPLRPEALPPIPRTLTGYLGIKLQAGVLDVIIDEHGNVERVIVEESVNTVYDRLMIEAAQKWKYQPATRAGAPVKYMKRIGVNPRVGNGPGVADR